MSPEADHNDWIEYRQLLLNDRQENLKFQQMVTKQLADLNTTLIEMKTERRLTKWAWGLLVPAIVSSLISLGMRFK